MTLRRGHVFVVGGGSHDITGIRYVGNYLLSTLVNVLFLTRFSDLCYGYNAFWRHCLKDVAIECDGFEIEALINLQMYKAKFKIVEIPSFEIFAYSRTEQSTDFPRWLASVEDDFEGVETI